MEVPGLLSGLASQHYAALRRAPSCVTVIFGAAGDLAHRKLIPAVFNLATDAAMPDSFVILGVDRDAYDDDSFRARMREAVASADSDFAAHVDEWTQFEKRLHYMKGDFKDPETYQALKKKLVEMDAEVPASEGHLFHLAIPPSLYATVIEHLSESGVLPRIGPPEQRPWARVIIEKPFGHDLESARALNGVARKAMAEHQIYRIDHYLGKETVQNLLVLRFANSIFEPLWNRHQVHHVQITAAEQIGIEHRGTVLRGSRRGARHVPESPAAAADPDGDGAAGSVSRRRRARRKGEGAPRHPAAHPLGDARFRGARTVRAGRCRRRSPCQGIGRKNTFRPTR